MEKSLTVIDSSQSTCGSCNSSGCGTCAPAPSVAPTSLSRREFGYAALLASAGTLLVGCSKEPAPQQAAQSAPAVTTTQGPAPTLSPDLEVVKESKLPIMTALEEFYKIGPGPSSSHTMGPMRIMYDSFRRVSKLGFISDRIGRRRPVIIGGATALLVCLAWILFGRAGVFPPYVIGLMAGVASGSGMVPYTVIKEAILRSLTGRLPE